MGNFCFEIFLLQLFCLCSIKQYNQLKALKYTMNNREKRIKRTIFALMILILLIITFSPWPPAVEAWNLNHWTTRDFPTIFSLLPPILGQPPKSECVSVFMCSRKQRFWGRRHSLFFLFLFLPNSSPRRGKHCKEEAVVRTCVEESRDVHIQALFSCITTNWFNLDPSKRQDFNQVMKVEIYLPIIWSLFSYPRICVKQISQEPNRNK